MTSREKCRALLDGFADEQLAHIAAILEAAAALVIPEDKATPDEVEAIQRGRAEYERGEFVRLEDVI